MTDPTPGLPPCAATTPPLEDLLYVCVVSEHLPPNYEACIAHRPARVALVISDGQKFGEAATRLRGMLEEALPGICVDFLEGQPGAYPLQGEGVIENQRWAQHVLLPWLRQPGLPRRRYLNFTGGTKAMAAVLLISYPWDSLDYTGRGQSEIQKTRLTLAGGVRFEELERRPVFNASPQEVARLYAQAASCVPLNRIIQSRPEDTLHLAHRIEQAQRQRQAALAGLFAALDAVWSNKNERRYDSKQVRLTWPEFLGAPGPCPEQRQWLEAFSALAPDALALTADGVTLPGNKPCRVGQALMRWISGVWLEQVAYEWLLEAGVPSSSIERNLVSAVAGPDNTESPREADLIIHENNRTKVIEIKAGLPRDKKPSEALQQLQSLGSRFGLADKALLISPALHAEIGSCPQRWRSFSTNCRASDIALITSREELARFAAAAP